MPKKQYGSSQREKQQRVKNSDIILTEVLNRQLQDLKNINAQPDEDTPEIKDGSLAEIGKFYRPIKKQITLRLDLDTLAWFKQQSGKYQSLINRACREYMGRHQEH